MGMGKTHQMKPEEKLYEKIWNRQVTAGPIVDRGSRADVALKLLEKGDKLLDVGCGDGTVGYFSKNNYRYVYGIDVSETALKIAKERSIITKTININDETLPFEDNYFDAVTCLDVIEHVFEPVDLIKEIFRVLKKGGFLIISTPNIRYWHHLFDIVIKGKFPKTSTDTDHYDGGHLHYFTYKDIENILENEGFKIVKKSGVFGRDIIKEFLSPGVVFKAKK